MWFLDVLLDFHRNLLRFGWSLPWVWDDRSNWWNLLLYSKNISIIKFGFPLNFLQQNFEWLQGVLLGIPIVIKLLSIVSLPSILSLRCSLDDGSICLIVRLFFLGFDVPHPGSHRELKLIIVEWELRIVISIELGVFHRIYHFIKLAKLCLPFLFLVL